MNRRYNNLYGRPKRKSATLQMAVVCAGGVFTGHGAGDCVDELRRPSGKTGTRRECPFAGRSSALTAVLQDALKPCDYVGMLIGDVVGFARISFEIVKLQRRIGF